MTEWAQQMSREVEAREIFKRTGKTAGQLLEEREVLLAALKRVGCQDDGSCGHEDDGLCFVCSALDKATS